MATFRSLPCELREMIWDLMLESQVVIPEIHTLDLSDFDKMVRSRSETVLSFRSRRPVLWPFKGRIVTAFPAVMHICGESCARAQKKLQFVRRYSHRDGLAIDLSTRFIRLDVDVFLITPHDVVLFNDIVTASVAKLPLEYQFHRHICHLAVLERSFEWPSAHEDLAELIGQLPSLRHFSVVAGPFTPDQCTKEQKSDSKSVSWGRDQLQDRAAEAYVEDLF